MICIDHIIVFLVSYHYFVYTTFIFKRKLIGKGILHWLVYFKSENWFKQFKE